MDGDLSVGMHLFGAKTGFGSSQEANMLLACCSNSKSGSRSRPAELDRERNRVLDRACWSRSRSRTKSRTKSGSRSQPQRLKLPIF